jgi:hypothetical protein
MCAPRCHRVAQQDPTRHSNACLGAEEAAHADGRRQGPPVQILDSRGGCHSFGTPESQRVVTQGFLR